MQRPRPWHLLAGVALCGVVPPAFAQEPPDELEIEVEVEDTPQPAEIEPPPVSPDDSELRARLAELEARLAEVEARPVPVPPPEPPPAPPPPRWQDDLELEFGGYLQSQVEFHQLSVDEISADGNPLNQDRFLVRRGRLAARATWRYASVKLEFDANTVHGPFVYAKTAEGSLAWPGKHEGDEPYAALVFGLEDIPFGFELPQSSRERPFMERTLGSRALFPSDNDVGIRVAGAFGPIVYDLGAQNGVPLPGDPGTETVDPVAKKNLVGRVGIDSGDSDSVRMTGGVSALKGVGFHAGNPETKDVLLWRDTNQDGVVTLNELVASQGQAATASETFDRWAVGADLEVSFHTPLGWTHLQAEGTMASNLDRGFYVADPISTSVDVRETAWSVAAIQDVTAHGLVGFRAERYDPDADLFESRRGQFLPLDASVVTLSPLIGARIDPLAKLVLQWDYVVDHQGRDTRGKPVDLPNDVWTLRLQMGF